MKNINLKIITGTNNTDLNLSDLVSSFSFSNFLDSNKEYTIFPGFLDCHVHLREPGFSYKETIKTGTLASAHGGYTAVCTMPNLNPVPDSISNLAIQEEIIKKDAIINVYPYASITKEEKGLELSDMSSLSNRVVAFSDDGRGVQSEAIMKKAMIEAKKLNKIIVAHCEVNDLLKGGYIHDGIYSKQHNHLGISSESEWKEIERDIRLIRETGAKFHVCHISTKESVDLIRKAKREGLNITCETAPHYLILDETCLDESGNYKMNPPLRGIDDRLALIEGIKDGTIDVIATDHAPHSKEEKSKGLKDSLFGITGIELAFPLLYTYLVKTNTITLEKLIDLIAINPRKIFNIPYNGFSVWDLNEDVLINEDFFLSKGKSSPFMNKTVYGVNHLTIVNNKIVYKK